MASHFLDIINGVILARTHAQVFGEDHPEHAENIQKFVHELDRVTIDLKSAVYGGNKP
jgi:ABC-type Zn uptake system ZnuABC Zn-binding protein ZnuA